MFHVKHKNGFFDQNKQKVLFWNNHIASTEMFQENENKTYAPRSIDFTICSERYTLKKTFFRSFFKMRYAKWLFWLLPASISAQDLEPIAIGQWNTFMSLQSAKDVTVANKIVYTAFSNGVMLYDIDEGSYEFLSKANGLSSINLSQVEYVPNTGMVVIGYSDGDMDIIQNDKSIINMADIKRSNILGDKSIYKIMVIDGFVYIATGFGIVVLDPNRLEIKDTYIFGPGGTNIKVNDITSDGTSLFAATDEGIFSGLLSNPFLANYASWTQDISINAAAVNGRFNSIEFFNGNLIATRSINGYNNDSIYIHNGSWSPFNFGVASDFYGVKTIDNKLFVIGNGIINMYDNALGQIQSNFMYNFGSINANDLDYLPSGSATFVADNYFGLTRVYHSFNNEDLTPSSPYTTGAVRVDANNGSVWVTHDGFPGVNVLNDYSKNLFSGTFNGSWLNFNATTNPVFVPDSVFDAVSVAIDPKDNNHVFIGSYSFKGLIEILDGSFVGFYDESNSAIESSGIAGYNVISSIKMDDDDNLWLVNSRSSSPLVVRKSDGSWRKFDLGNDIKNKHIFDLEIGKSGVIWIALPTGNSNGGLMAFNPNGTIDDLSDDERFFYLPGAGSGNLPSQDVRSIAEDLDEEMWIGTANGIAVVYDQFAFFNGSNGDAQQILIEQDGNIQILLEGEVISDIEVDGANRKWIATEGSGAYLISEDGTDEILHLTAENSPLLSNIVNDISIDHEDGTIYFATASGLISFRYTATGSKNAFNEVVAFPNPVHHDYEGLIAVKGLSRNSDFKITDISGNIVYHGISEGGQAIWDLKDIKGNRVSSGVYLVYCNSENGSKDAVAKLLVIN